MEAALEMARSKDTKERMAGVERLYQILEASRKTMSSAEVTSLVDCCLDLLKDNNYRVAQGALQALASASVLSGEHFKLHFNSLVPAVVERMGDGKQPVRDAARRLLLTLMEVSSPTIIVERAGSYAWMHKSWRVREEFARTVASAIGLFASTELPLQRVILPPILQMLNDSNHSVREAAVFCIEEMYAHVGTQFREELQRHHLPASMVKEINARLEKIEPKTRSSNGLASHSLLGETKSATLSHKKSSPKNKNFTREVSLAGGESDVTEKPVDAITVYSEKELIREFEKIASTLVPEKDWSVRIAAMQRIEGLLYGGAADYPCFPTLLKQLVAPLSTQLSDRRSSVVKQGCHLLCLLSKDLLGDFEACAEMFIPVLFKLVVITVLVIAESADNCIKTMLRNCKVARVLPRIADCAKNDRNAVLRARCCDYALLILEYWADAPEIQRAADLYEDLIKCCVADAMSEVRATARTCYRMFTKTWPDRARRLFLAFDPIIQRVINEEDGGVHRRYTSPTVRDRNLQSSRTSSQTTTPNLPGYGTSAIVAMDRSASLPSGMSFSSGPVLSQAKSLGEGTERSLESVLHSSKQKVTAIESMLRGLNMSEKHGISTVRSTSFDLGVDPPSARDPPFPSAVSSSIHATSSMFVDSTASHISKALPVSYSTKRGSERIHDGNIFEENTDMRVGRQYMTTQVDRQYLDTPYREGYMRESQNSYIPNFQRPLARKHVTGRVPASSRNSFDDSQLALGEMPSYMAGPASLNDALTEGLSSSSDWSARVSAFNYLKTLLQQGPRGIQEITQSFEKVMKLFFKHLDDPHHKVAQAALSTLAEMIPSCRKPFESYVERILPHVFSRLIDQKELVRQSCSTTLETVSKTYGIDSLLPALLRSLDEQRSPKAKLAVIDFAISSFNKHSMNSESSGNSGILKLWLAKLAPLVHDKNTKLKEAAVAAIIAVYSHFDSTSVLNFILSLSVDEQNSLRRALKQFTPRIEVDLMNFLQNRREKQRTKSFHDQSDTVGTSSEDGYPGALKKPQYFGRFSAGSIDSDGGRKWSSMQESTLITSSIGQDGSDEVHNHMYQNLEASSNREMVTSKSNDQTVNTSNVLENMGLTSNHLENGDHILSSENSLSAPRPQVEINGMEDSGLRGNSASGLDKESFEVDLNHEKPILDKINASPDSGTSIPQILHQICNGSDESAYESKQPALQKLIDISMANNHLIWSKYFNQILTVVLEVLEDPDSSIRELALSLIIKMLNYQKGSMGDSVEIVLEKLLHVTKDMVAKVSNDAEQCLTIVLSHYDPFRCLTVIVPLLVSEDEKTLVTCINCLTKLVGRFSQEELTAQLPSFLPALFEAFGNQSADVRKTVVFCLVDIYIILGKSFLPYLEGLNSTQLRLVTIYANRISQARSGAVIDANHG